MGVGAEFFVLGPLRVRRDGAELSVPPGKQRALLAALLLDSGRAVPIEELAEVLWGTGPPPSARVALQNHVMRLRKSLGGELIRTQPHGYQIQPGDLDLTRFEAHLAAAQSAAWDGDWRIAAARARAGLDLWRGEPLADVDSDLLATRDIPRLTELRLQATELRLDADLHLGRHREATAGLRTLTAAHPLRERLHGLLMLALYRDGRQAEALAAYADARQILVSQVGTEPGPALRDLHRQILNGDPDLDLPSAGPAADGVETAILVPRQLPPSIPHFTGRAGDLTALTRMLQEAAGVPGAVVISAIGGTAGVGKTTLALHWAHLVAGRFGDGQLYVDLRGFGSSGPPLAPEAAIRGFLGALGVPSQRVPAQPDAQAGLYRSLLADRKTLIVLDNARDDAQVRPLLPASPGSLVLVTSRSQLSGLAATDGARLLALDVPGHDEALDLLAARLGADRITAEPDAADEIASVCAHLPLALAVAAARAVTQPGFSLSALAAELRDTAGRLDALDAGEPPASVRTVFSWSYDQLSPGAARLFRLLGLHPGPDTSVRAAASLAAAAVPEAHHQLRELARAHLITEHVPGRYAFHDLLRAYAAARAHDTETETDRREATGRTLDHYLHTALAAGGLLDPAAKAISLAPPRPGTVPEPIADHRRALAWFESEHHVLLSAIALADSSGFDRRAWQLPWAMARFLRVRGHYQEWAALQRTALDAATRSGNAAGQAHSSRLLAAACADLGDHHQALIHYDRSLRLYQQIGNRLGEAGVHRGLSALAERQGRDADARAHVEQALSLYRGLGDKAARGALALSVRSHELLGDAQQARTSSQKAIDRYAENDDRAGEGLAWYRRGHAEHRLGNFGEAAACYERALGMAREYGFRPGEATVLLHLGDTLHADGEIARAREAWEQALAIFTDIQHPGADEVRDRLADLNGAGRGTSPPRSPE